MNLILVKGIEKMEDLALRMAKSGDSAYLARITIASLAASRGYDVSLNKIGDLPLDVMVAGVKLSAFADGTYCVFKAGAPNRIGSAYKTQEAKAAAALDYIQKYI